MQEAREYQMVCAAERQLAILRKSRGQVVIPDELRYASVDIAAGGEWEHREVAAAEREAERRRGFRL